MFLFISFYAKQCAYIPAEKMRYTPAELCFVCSDRLGDYKHLLYYENRRLSFYLPTDKILNNLSGIFGAKYPYCEIDYIFSDVHFLGGRGRYFLPFDNKEVLERKKKRYVSPLLEVFYIKAALVLLCKYP